MARFEGLNMQDYRLHTPEAVDVTFEVAGIGTRFLAATLDLLTAFALLLLIVLGAFAVGTLGSIGRTLGIVLGISLSFILVWGYYIIFETIWSGQTPGKRILHIRVILTSGQPIGFVEAVIRNLVRIVDWLPALYGVGVIAMFISTQSRRLGDYAAGTIVIKERSGASLADVQPIGHGAVPGYNQPAIGTMDPDELAWNLRGLTPQDLVVVREYVDRAPALPPAARDRIGNEISGRVAERIGARLPLNPVIFLRRVLYLAEGQDDNPPQSQ